MSMLPRKENEKWPIVKETTRNGKGFAEVRKFTITDARNTWKVVIYQNRRKQFSIEGFSGFFFEFYGKDLRCFKIGPLKTSESGQVACLDDRFNLVNDNGKRKTLRLKNFKKYVIELFND